MFLHKIIVFVADAGHVKDSVRIAERKIVSDGNAMGTGAQSALRAGDFIARRKHVSYVVHGGQLFSVQGNGGFVGRADILFNLLQGA